MKTKKLAGGAQDDAVAVEAAEVRSRNARRILQELDRGHVAMSLSRMKLLKTASMMKSYRKILILETSTREPVATMKTDVIRDAVDGEVEDEDAGGRNDQTRKSLQIRQRVVDAVETGMMKITKASIAIAKEVHVADQEIAMRTTEIRAILKENLQEMVVAQSENVAVMAILIQPDASGFQHGKMPFPA
jgi:hypothetical protein